MCGIAGYIDYSAKTSGAFVSPMVEAINYRGPDSSGEFHSKSNVAHMGVRRLKIVDLTTGDQPIANEDGNLIIVFNGEIYGYKDMRGELTRKGHILKTTSDTEILLHMYEEYGEKMLNKINGMYAFAIWDEKKQKVFLARDRCGIKPLYYAKVGSILIFGSEAKTILKFKDFKKEISNEGLDSYFYLGYLLGGLSIYKNISKLKPGHYLTCTKNELKVKKYFNLNLEKSFELNSLDDLLQKSVKDQLIADVPVGVFLSGGLDSSLIAYYISKFAKLKSFSIGFSEKGFDESKYAHYVADKLGTEHFSQEYSVKDVINSFDEITSRLDEPFADASIFPTYKVCKLARKYVKVVLSGDGGDELFGGYPTYQAQILSKYLSIFPDFVFEYFLKIVEILPHFILDFIPTSFKDYSKSTLAKIVLSGLKIDDVQERHLYWMRTFFLGDKIIYKDHDLRGGYLKDIGENSYTQDIYGRAFKINPALAGQVIDFQTYLPDDFLFKVDRASMYNSLEVRVPYLDNRVVNYAFSLKEQHVNLFNTKIQLRRLLSQKLPDVAKRPKKGFGIPLEKWLRGKLKSLGYSMLSNRRLYQYVGKDKIDTLWSEHQKMKANHKGVLWQLIIFSAWLDKWE